MITKKSLVDKLVETKLVLSKAEGRRVIAMGGVFVNEERVSDPQIELLDSAIDRIRVGKTKVWEREDNE